jgi:hypothetical protein
MNQDMIAQMATEIEASRLLVYKAAWAKDQGKLNNGLDVAMAKYFAGETVNKCANLRHAHPGRLRLLHRIPGGAPLPGYAHLLPWWKDRPTSRPIICKWIHCLGPWISLG